MINKKWHLHLLTFPLGIVLLNWADKGFLQLDEVGGFFNNFIIIFISAALAFCVEWYQGVKGYNRGVEAKRESRKDMLVSVIGGVLAVFVGGNLTVSLISFCAISGIEIFRRINLRKK